MADRQLFLHPTPLRALQPDITSVGLDPQHLHPLGAFGMFPLTLLFIGDLPTGPDHCLPNRLVTHNPMPMTLLELTCRRTVGGTAHPQMNRHLPQAGTELLPP